MCAAQPCRYPGSTGGVRTDAAGLPRPAFLLEHTILELFYGCGRIAQVRIKQRRREPEGRFRAEIGVQRAESVRIPMEVPNSQDCATHARRREKTPPCRERLKT